MTASAMNWCRSPPISPIRFATAFRSCCGKRRAESPREPVSQNPPRGRTGATCRLMPRRPPGPGGGEYSFRHDQKPQNGNYKPFKLDDVRERLTELHIDGMTVSEAKG